MGQERYRSIDTYSTGMKQRAKLAQALVHDPKLIILDEPTNGLDPAGREQILQLIGSVWREYGISVMVSSHLLHDVERICDSVIIIANGRILEHETIQTLKSRLRSRFEIVPSGDAERFSSVLSTSGHEVERLSNGRLRVESDTASIQWLLSLMRENDLPPAEIVSSSNALHDLFVQSLNSADNGHHV
jgi:ABC-2 type transport system ATP-binding protein